MREGGGEGREKEREKGILMSTPLRRLHVSSKIFFNIAY